MSLLSDEVDLNTAAAGKSTRYRVYQNIISSTCYSMDMSQTNYNMV